MNSVVQVYMPENRPPEARQILRYMGCRGEAPEEVRQLAEEAAKGLRLQAKACYIRLPVREKEPNTVDFGCMTVKSADLFHNLLGCREVYWMAATIGMESERQISRMERISPAKSLALDAAGSAAVEEVCGQTNRYLREQAEKEGKFLRPRFSAGYGDFPLRCQKEMIEILDAGRKIGVTLTENLMLLPVKSVTAVIGISDRPVQCAHTGCEACEALDCPYRA